MSEQSYESKITELKSQARFSRIASSVLAIGSIPTLAYSVNELINNDASRGAGTFVPTFIGAFCFMMSRECNANSQENTQIAANLQAQQIIEQSRLDQSVQAPIE